MKIPVIRQLAQDHSLAVLKEAEENLMNEQALPIEVQGEDEGEQLTHILGAIAVREEMEKGADLVGAVRAYTQRVRDSIK